MSGAVGDRLTAPLWGSSIGTRCWEASDGGTIGRQVPPTIGQIPLDSAFPDRPVEFAHELHLDDRLTLDVNRRSWLTGFRVNPWSATLLVSPCWLLMEDRPGVHWINRATSFVV